MNIYIDATKEKLGQSAGDEAILIIKKAISEKGFVNILIATGASQIDVLKALVSSDYPINMPVLRFTDVKLMYAEVLNEESYDPSGEAFAILNEIRDRAGLGRLTAAEVPTQVAFREAMLNERRLEFAYEFLRWFDLYRTDKAMSVMNARPDAAQFPMQEYHKILPIPQHELNVNIDRQVMWQNPGY